MKPLRGQVAALCWPEPTCFFIESSSLKLAFKPIKAHQAPSSPIKARPLPYDAYNNYVSSMVRYDAALHANSVGSQSPVSVLQGA